MKYDLSQAKDSSAAFAYLVKLTEQKALAEVVKISPQRSLNQNAYLHLILAAFGDHFGYTAPEAKIVYKQLNKDLYYYKKKGRLFQRSSTELTKEEMAQSIDYFMQKSAEQGYPLPPATDQAWLMSISNDIEKGKFK